MTSQTTTKKTIRKAPVRRPHQRRTVSRKRKLRLRTRIALVSLAVIAVLLVWAEIARAFAPRGNTSSARFDTIIVLGSPADADGNPTPTQLSRVTEAVHEYERGVAPHLILTGGPTRHSYVEAQIMERTAEAQGVPSSSIFVEPQAMDTIHNGCYSVGIMQAHGWRSAEVISSASHLPRAGLIFSRLPIDWRTHAAPSLEPEGDSGIQGSAPVEILKTLRYLVYAQWAERCE